MYLMSETPSVRPVVEQTVSTDPYIMFLCKIEGWKTKCKNLHWAAPNDTIHRRLDDLNEILSDYQDTLAEDYMGIYGKVRPDILNGIPSDKLDAMSFVDEVISATLAFYESIETTSICSGIKSETETFIHNLNKIKYLFSLCV